MSKKDAKDIMQQQGHIRKVAWPLLNVDMVHQSWDASA